MASSSKKITLLGKRKPEDGLETKPFLRKHKEKETTKGIPEQRVELLETKSDETPDFAETVATVRKKTLFVANLSRQTQMSDIINFFKDVGEVVHVRLLLDHWGRLRGYGFVGFASADEANKVLEKKNGKYFHNSEIFLGVADRGASEYLEGTMYCIDHKVWYEDYLQRESLLIEEDAAAVETPDIAEEVAVRNKTVFVAAKLANKIRITSIFKDRLFSSKKKDVVRVRDIVDHKDKHVGCWFVEFASANEAKKAVQEKNGSKFFARMAEIDRPYPFRPKYKLAERLWYEDNLLRKNLCEKSKGNLVFSGKRTTFSDNEYA